MRTLIIFFLVIVSSSGCKKGNDIITTPPIIPPAKVPVMITNPITDISLFAATLHGKIVDTGSSKLLEQGFVIDTLPMPTISKNHNKFTSQPDINGIFKTTILNIPTNKTWYVRSYGINAQGAGYGSEVSFTSLPEKIFTGNITLNTQLDINNFGANNYTTILGTLTIDGPVTDLTPLSSLVIIGNGLRIEGTQLVDFKGLEKLEIIGRDFYHYFRIYNNPTLKNFFGLKKLRIVKGGMSVYNSAALVNLSGLENLTTVDYGEFRVESCPSLTSLTGLEKLQEVLGNLIIRFNPLIQDLKPLSNLSIISQELRIHQNISLQKLEGLEKVSSLEDLNLTDNAMLSDISGLSNITIIKYGINIDNNDALTNINGLDKVQKSDLVEIQNNAALVNIEGLKNLQSIRWTLKLQNNSLLNNIQGLRRLKSAYFVDINSNTSLVNLTGLDSLNTIYSLGLYGNNQLQTLNGLNRLTRADGPVGITGNPLLINFCALKPLFVAGYTNVFTCNNNGANPTQASIVTNCP